MMTDSLERFLQDLRFDVPAGLVDRAKAAAAIDATGARQAVRGTGHNRGDFDRQRHGWALAVVAGLVAIAIVATLVFAARSLHPKQITPANPIPHRAASSASCVAHAAVTPSQVVPEKMLSPTMGWAQGALRTTDGGLHWYGISPTSAPDASGSYADFFLDSTHAWTAQAVSSPTSCSAVTFMTTDGGQTWQQSEPVSVDVQADSEVELQLNFIDAQHGWLLAEAGQWMFGHGPVDAYLYVTSDGGLHWRQISHRPGTAASGACEAKLGNVVFASQTTGWSLPQCPDTTLLVTHDGGATWNAQRLPLPSQANCPCSARLPIFFDQQQGIVSVVGNAGQQSLLATSDGGGTWSYRALPPTGYSLTIDFIDANSGWDVVTPPGWSKGISGAPKDWLYRTVDGGQTWTLVQADLPLGYPIIGLWFVDANNGFAAQENVGLTGPELLRTTDGGHTWKVIETQITRT
jgi:photosystem II stability/assembly factor-like uncharacterized protein